MSSYDVMELIKQHEGFEEKPYPDPLHGWDVPTFGYGFTYITKEESDVLLFNRVKKIEKELSSGVANFYTYPRNIRFVMIEMAYQIGVYGLFKFKNTLKYLNQGDYKSASVEMLDSKWAKQTPNRAKELSDIVYGEL